jgi:hypothetical protein
MRRSLSFAGLFVALTATSCGNSGSTNSNPHQSFLNPQTLATSIEEKVNSTPSSMGHIGYAKCSKKEETTAECDIAPNAESAQADILAVTIAADGQSWEARSEIPNNGESWKGP